MIQPHCDKCGNELKEFGGILLSPPIGNDVKKFHLCVNCYEDLTKEWIINVIISK